MSNTKLLIHSDDADGSTSFIDSSPNNSAVTAKHGAVHDDAQAYFGNSSIYLSGGLSGAPNLSVSNYSGVQLGSSDFTIDVWLRPSAFGDQIICAKFGGSSTKREWKIRINATNIRFDVENQASGGTLSVNSGNIVNFAHGMSANTWYHVALVRSGSSLYCFVDGAQVGSTATITGTAASTSEPFCVGAYDENLRGFIGHMDEVRVVKGEAKWTGNFTPPTSAYCDDS